jgi:dTDP-3-amino-2,3,6-trideoxy-4-keto-D-glucose/dTDP-3-amino-3,4,6-trideoxy-alpha-D-glucose/dTDP-2,6-dideoxy-D-kanosamine transaminase
MKVSANYLARQFTKPVTEAILDDIRALVESGDFTLGKPLQEFERRFSALVGGREVIAVNSGTEALILALKALGIGPGDEVITVPNTFYATVGAIVAVGATPRFCDVDASHQMDPEKIRTATTSKTKAVLPVWLGGTPPDLHRIRLRTPASVLMLEDSCQAVGASLMDQASGTWGDAAAFSFHPLKPLLVWGDGGAVVLPNSATREAGLGNLSRGVWLRVYRDHGKLNRNGIKMWGINARMHTLQCVVALRGIDGVAEAVRKRQLIAEFYDRWLGEIESITIPVRRGKSSWRSYVIEAELRDWLKDALIADGIDAAIHYPTPLHLQPPGRALGYGPGDFPVAERQAKRMLTLPLNEFLRTDEIDYVVERVRLFYGA